MTDKPQLHVGYVGRTREGKRVTIIGLSPNRLYKWADENGRSYCDDGRYFKSGRGPGDITGPWIEPAPAKEYKPGVWYSWSGAACPFDGTTEVKCMLGDGRIEWGEAAAFDWIDFGGNTAVIAFTVLDQPKPTTYTVTVEVSGLGKEWAESLEGFIRDADVMHKHGSLSTTITEDTETP
jgi:hypothetical protein